LQKKAVMRKLKNAELNRKNIEEFKSSKKIPVIIVLDNIRSANNIGSVFRTSDAFLIKKIHLCGITATPPNKDIHKTAIGATDSVDWEYFKNTIDSIQNLKASGYKIVSVEQVENGNKLEDFIPVKDQKYAIVLGNEVKGVSQNIVDISDYCIEIDQFGTKHSLNISVCTGIVIWEFFKKLS
jgi:23S rRNA (guanosine2251-2'-O)-methyltransferase